MGRSRQKMCRVLPDGKRAAAPAGMESLSQVARLMAERTTQSWTSVPHFFWCGMLTAAN